MNLVKYPIAIAVLLVQVLFAGDDADRAKLLGAWQTSGQSEALTWTLAMHGDLIHITVTQDNRKLSEFECAASGRDCDVKVEGKPAKVSMWFNGPKLVVMETRGSEVTKRRFSTTSEGSRMELETIPIVPSGKLETVHLSRTSDSHQPGN
jgi:hypothetical protein